MQDVRHLVSAEFISIYTEWRNLVSFETTHCSDVWTTLNVFHIPLSYVHVDRIIIRIVKRWDQESIQWNVPHDAEFW